MSNRRRREEIEEKDDYKSGVSDNESRTRSNRDRRHRRSHRERSHESRHSRNNRDDRHKKRSSTKPKLEPKKRSSGSSRRHSSNSSRSHNFSAVASSNDIFLNIRHIVILIFVVLAWKFVFAFDESIFISVGFCKYVNK